MTLGTVGALLGLLALTRITTLWQFYAVWAWLGLMMAATLYDATFSIVTRARGPPRAIGHHRDHRWRRASPRRWPIR